MNISSGTILFLLILGGLLLLLVILLIVFALANRKRRKLPGGIKFLTILLAIPTFVFSILTPLAHYNVIDVNLRFGWYSHKDENGTKIKITRDSIEYHPSGSGADKKGTYVLESDTLTITWKGGGTEKYEIKHLGSKLYQNGKRIYSYLKDQGGLD